MGVQNTPEFTTLWSEWLRTPDGAGYEAGWGDFANRWHAERGRVWCLERLLERAKAENEGLRSEAEVTDLALQLTQPAVNVLQRENADLREAVERLTAQRDDMVVACNRATDKAVGWGHHEIDRLTEVIKVAALLIHRGNPAGAQQTLSAAVGPQPEGEWHRVARICDAAEDHAS